MKDENKICWKTTTINVDIETGEVLKNIENYNLINVFKNYKREYKKGKWYNTRELRREYRRARYKQSSLW